MRRRLALVAIVASALAALAITAVPAGADVTQPRTLTVAGVSRSYLFHRGSGTTAGARVPLVIALHGSSGGPSRLESQTGWSDLADRVGFLVAYPDGQHGSGSWSGCCTPVNQNDIAFLAALIAQVTASDGGDPSRVYVVGSSAGALTSYYGACALSGQITAIASVSGAFNGNGGCQLLHPVSLIEVHGSADRNVPYQGIGSPGDRPYLPSTPDVVSAWAASIGCGPSSTTTAGSVDTTDFALCPAGAAVRLVTLQGSGHGWPRTAAFDTTAVVWQFLSTRTWTPAGGPTATTTVATVATTVRPGTTAPASPSSASPSTAGSDGGATTTAGTTLPPSATVASTGVPPVADATKDPPTSGPSRWWLVAAVTGLVAGGALIGASRRRLRPGRARTSAPR